MQRIVACVSIALAASVFAPCGRAVSSDQIAALFRPFLAEQVTLSPDGQRIAYTEHVRDELFVVIMALDEPYAKVRLRVDEDLGLTFSKEKERAALSFLRWATPNRLVFAPVGKKIGARIVTSVLAVDADGKNPRTLIDGPDLVAAVPNQNGDFVLKPRAGQVVGFPAQDREHILVEAVGYEFRALPAPPPPGEHHAPPIPVPLVVPTTLFKVDVVTGKKTEISSEFIVGTLGYDHQGKSRLSYPKPTHAVERPFHLLGVSDTRLDALWLGPTAGRFSLSPQNYFGERAIPLGFDDDPDVLFVASNVGRDTFGIYGFNLRTHQRTGDVFEDSHVDLVPLEPAYPGSQLVFDELTGKLAGVRSPGARPASLWRDPQLARTQEMLDRKFPDRTVILLEWSSARTAFLLRVTGGSEPGRYFVFKQPGNLMLELMRRAPWIAASTLNPTEFFAFDSPQGVHLTGYLTLPLHARLSPPPAVMCFASGFPPEAQAEFDRESQVLASMGFLVIRLNHRGVGGFGIRHRDAILAGIDRVPIEDALATIEWIAQRHPLDRKRIATWGSGFGGYLAVRALQLQPTVFRCGVAMNAPLDPEGWLRPEVNVDLGAPPSFPQEVIRAFLQRGAADLAALGATQAPEPTAPVFLLVDAGRTDGIGIANLRLRDRIRRRGGVADYLEVNADFDAGLPGARTTAYEKIEEFFNLNLYDYKVKIGETRELK